MLTIQGGFLTGWCLDRILHKLLLYCCDNAASDTDVIVRHVLHWLHAVLLLFPWQRVA